MLLSRQLLIVADAYAAAASVSLSVASSRALAESKTLPGLAEGRTSPTLKRADQAMRWFADHWPESAVWPHGVPRPSSQPPHGAGEVVAQVGGDVVVGDEALHDAALLGLASGQRRQADPSNETHGGPADLDRDAVHEQARDNDWLGEGRVVNALRHHSSPSVSAGLNPPPPAERSASEEGRFVSASASDAQFSGFATAEAE